MSSDALLLTIKLTDTEQTEINLFGIKILAYL